MRLIEINFFKILCFKTKKFKEVKIPPKNHRFCQWKQHKKARKAERNWSQGNFSRRHAAYALEPMIAAITVWWNTRQCKAQSSRRKSEWEKCGITYQKVKLNFFLLLSFSVHVHGMYACVSHGCRFVCLLKAITLEPTFFSLFKFSFFFFCLSFTKEKSLRNGRQQSSQLALKVISN